MVTEIGSSSAADVSGDWVNDFKAMFVSPKQQFSIGCLISVPDHLRKLDEQAFTPLLISIGPIHRSITKLQTMNRCKLQFCERFIQRANINWEELLYAVKEKEKEIRSYYVEDIVSSISIKDFVKMIVLDGMFILEYFLRHSNPHLERNDSMIAEWMHRILKFDLVILGNQLPFFVLDMLFKQAKFPAGLGIRPLNLKQLAFAFFECYDFQGPGVLPLDGHVENLTDLVRLFYLRGISTNVRPEGDKLSYSATQLHEAGVELKGVEWDVEGGWFVDKRFWGFESRRRSREFVNGSRRCCLDIRFLLPEALVKLWGVGLDEEEEFNRLRRHFLEIRFHNGVLEIPCIKLNGERIRLIRNIIALEQSHYVGHTYVTDFFVFLDFLVDNSKDVDLLCDKGILVNYLGDSNTAASAVNSFSTDMLLDYMNPEYSKICKDLNAFCKKPWHRWRATLWRQYFCTPWRAASTSAAILLLLLTGIQTVCALWSTNW
ncbi:UPF0481 protein At3g47200-like [Quercus robur]|uniref:UPF0481 protein At3g47200-like n=1 Tax=Quercus robur TaxID=38942 RepID=UPI0021614DBD|nr:UPF0481 protein At3g47200-like [Quercus robur]XP_050252362.1 UPF0481 protein At3g47200-like [Quercus robur]